MIPFLMYLFMVLFIIVSIFLILLVLIQKGRGGGLSGAFGGAGGNTAFGSKTGDVLTWVTSVTFGIFLLLAIGLNLAANKNQELRSAGVITVNGSTAGGNAPAGSSSPTPAPTK